MKHKIVFIAKTNLNTDGRILNELKILKKNFKNLYIDFILMPDKPLVEKVEEVDEFHIINTVIRNNSFLRLFTVVEFTCRALMKLIKLKPELVHIQDTMVTLPVYLFKLIKPKVKIIYDDHEVPNSNESFQIKVFQYFETLLMKKSDYIIAANKERIEYLNKHLNKTDYLLNLPYFENREKTIDSIKVKEILQDKNDKALKFIMHQGIIGEERGREKLAEFSQLLPEKYKILIIGVSQEYFQYFISEYNLDENNFYFVGIVPYNILGQYWYLADASIVMYLPTYVNNRLCAPNRLYISYFNQLPIIVNRDNPVLYNFIIVNNCGAFIEDIKEDNLEEILNIKFSSDKIEALLEKEVSKLLNIYNKVL